MKKVSVSMTNDYCPQTLFIYGTNNADGTVDFGTFCWFSYCWNENLGVICAIGGDKRTKKNILREGKFSANMATEELLHFTDYCSLSGEGEKRFDPANIQRGAVLDVPTLADSPVTFELELRQCIEQADGAVVLICRIANVLMREDLARSSASAAAGNTEGEVPMDPAECMRNVHPLLTTVGRYFTMDGRCLGRWHELPEAEG